MYENFYKLSGRPFQLMPDPRLLFKSRDHSRALSYLLYGLERREGFVVITGDVGMGKTLLVQTLLGEPRTRNTAIGRLAMANLDGESVLPAVASAFGLAHKARTKIELLDDLVGRVLPAQSRGALLIIDEAQTCTVDALEELRAISNLQANGRALLQIFLIGQTDLREILARPQMTHMRQRIVASHQLQPLDADEVRDYVTHRLGVVGWRDDPHFDEDVFTLAHEWTRGVPRRLNLLMDRLLLYGYLEQRHELSAEDIQVVIGEFEEEFEDPQSKPVAAPPVSTRGEDFSDTDIGELSRRLVSLERALIGVLGQEQGERLLEQHELSGNQRELLAAQMRIAQLESLLTELAAYQPAQSQRPDVAEPPARQASKSNGVSRPLNGAKPEPMSVGDAIDAITPGKRTGAPLDEEDEDVGDDDHTLRWRLFSKRRKGEH